MISLYANNYKISYSNIKMSIALIWSLLILNAKIAFTKYFIYSDCSAMIFLAPSKASSEAKAAIVK